MERMDTITVTMGFTRTYRERSSRGPFEMVKEGEEFVLKLTIVPAV